jgi:hypothetical protein
MITKFETALVIFLTLYTFDAHSRSLSPDDVESRYQAFLTGGAQLDGNIFSPSNTEKEAFSVLWKAKQWEDLARAVIKSKPYHSDLIWFYLGEAAAGVGKHAIAAAYYGNSVVDATSSNGNAHCGSIKLFGKDNCYGLVFPADAAAKLGGHLATEKIKKSYPKIQSRFESRAKLVVGPTNSPLPVIPLGNRFVAGYADLRAVVGKEAVSGLRELGNQSMSYDVIYSFTDPKSILLISRTQTFAHLGNFDESPTSGTMKASLIEKYGNPAMLSVVEQRPVDLMGGRNPDPFNQVTMMWFSGNTAKRVGAASEPANRLACADLGNQIDTDGMPQPGTIRILYETGYCGTVLIYRFSVFAGDRVGDASAMLFNGEKITDDYSQYVKSAATGAKAQEQKDIDRRNAIKPVL